MVWVHEWAVAPAVFAVGLAHGRRALGGRRAAGEMLALVGYGYALEAVAIGLFGSHTYGTAWALAPLGVPVAVAVVWAAVISSAMALGARVGGPGSLARAVRAALIAMSLDLLMEPVAVRAGLWRWTPPGPWLGVPVGNFVGWAVIVAVYAWGAERFAGDRPAQEEAARRIAQALVSVLALVVVGLAWKRSRAEYLFADGRGWIAWAAILVAAAATARSPARATLGTGLAGRLGRAPGRGPQAVFLILAAVFAIDAAVLQDPRLWPVALGPIATLLWISGRASSGSSARNPAATAPPAPRVPGGGGG